MKRCNSCGAVYDDSYDICVACGCRLSQETEGQKCQFSERRGSATVFHGVVTQTQTRQYYQNGFAKVIRALFAGEPYQLGHTSNLTVVRVEERTGNGSTGQAQEVVIYGGIQSILTAGDQVTIHTRHRGNRYVATRIFNHTVNNDVRIEGNVAAGVVWTLLILALVVIGSIIGFVASINYAAVGQSVMDFIGSLLPAGLSLLAAIWIIRSFFRL